VHPSGRGHALYGWAAARGGAGDHARVLHAAAPWGAGGLCPICAYLRPLSPTYPSRHLLL